MGWTKFVSCFVLLWSGHKNYFRFLLFIISCKIKKGRLHISPCHLHIFCIIGSYPYRQNHA
jgi:hypothetical protein